MLHLVQYSLISLLFFTGSGYAVGRYLLAILIRASPGNALYPIDPVIFFNCSDNVIELFILFLNIALHLFYNQVVTACSDTIAYKCFNEINRTPCEMQQQKIYAAKCSSGY